MMGASVLDAGQDALARGAWAQAAACFEEVLAERETGAAHEGLARARWWLNDEAGTLAAREAAHRAYRAEGDVHGAARTATWLAGDHLDFRGDDAVASAWLGRARQLLDGLPPCPEEAWVVLLEADLALLALNDGKRAQERARRAVQLARELGLVDVEAVGLAILGWALCVTGEVQEGRQALEDATSLAVSEEFEELIAIGWVLCHTVTASTDLGDFTRAGQWCTILENYAERWAGRHFAGICRSAHGWILVAGGAWADAEAELTCAVDDLMTTRPALAMLGALRLADLRARQGRADEARELYESVRPHPLALVGLGSLDLEAGDAEGAADAAERVLRQLPPGQLLDRLPALELLVGAAAALGDLPRTRAALDELERSAATLGTPYLRARAKLAATTCAAAARDHDAARCAAEDAVDGFGSCGAPYDAALARVALADALDALGRREGADAERAAAREILEALGARRDVARAQGPAPSALGELSPRELEVLRLVAQGCSDAQIAERLVLSPHTVHRHVANVRTKLRLPSRAAAVAFAAREGLL